MNTADTLNPTHTHFRFPCPVELVGVATYRDLCNEMGGHPSRSSQRTELRAACAAGKMVNVRYRMSQGIDTKVVRRADLVSL